MSRLLLFARPFPGIKETIELLRKTGVPPERVIITYNPEGQPGTPSEEFRDLVASCRKAKQINQIIDRLRLAISSSNFDRFDINPNTGEPYGDHAVTRELSARRFGATRAGGNHNIWRRYPPRTVSTRITTIPAT